MPSKVHHTREDYQRFLSSQSGIFEFAKHQIRTMYPKAHIHVLTNNKNGKDDNLLTHHYEEFAPNHTVKFKLFGLLREPAMYLDNDVFLNRKFSPLELPNDVPFNCYSYSFTNVNLQNMSPVQLPCKVNNILNGGVIWIPKPSQEIVQALEEIHNKYFDHRQWLLSRNQWVNNDEWSLSLLTARDNISMRIMPQVNVRRGDGPLNRHYQSVHYTGIFAKDLMFAEVPFLRKLGR